MITWTCWDQYLYINIESSWMESWVMCSHIKKFCYKTLFLNAFMYITLSIFPHCYYILVFHFYFLDHINVRNIFSIFLHTLTQVKDPRRSRAGQGFLFRVVNSSMNFGPGKGTSIKAIVLSKKLYRITNWRLLVSNNVYKTLVNVTVHFTPLRRHLRVNRDERTCTPVLPTADITHGSYSMEFF